MELFPLLGFIDIKTALLVGHLFGVALGAGTALFSGVIFTKIMYDGRVTKNEMQFLEVAGWMVTFGLTLLVLSGLGMFLLDQARYLASTKFMAKMTVIGILILNGITIHTTHMPALKKHLGKYLPEIGSFKKRSYLMYAGGAISMTSWATALILGAFRGVPYSYGTIMLTYVLILIGAIALSIALRGVMFAKGNKRES